jgi:hypothetical protein
VTTHPPRGAPHWVQDWDGIDLSAISQKAAFELDELAQKGAFFKLRLKAETGHFRSYCTSAYSIMFPGRNRCTVEPEVWQPEPFDTEGTSSRMSDYVSINVAGKGVFDYKPITVGLTDVMKAFHWLSMHPYYFKQIGRTSQRIAKQNNPYGMHGNFITEGRSKHPLIGGGNLHPYQDKTHTSSTGLTVMCALPSDDTKVCTTNESMSKARAMITVNGEMTWICGRPIPTKTPQEPTLVPDDPPSLEPRT